MCSSSGWVFQNLQALAEGSSGWVFQNLQALAEGSSGWVFQNLKALAEGSSGASGAVQGQAGCASARSGGEAGEARRERNTGAGRAGMELKRLGTLEAAGNDKGKSWVACKVQTTSNWTTGTPCAHPPLPAPTPQPTHPPAADALRPLVHVERSAHAVAGAMPVVEPHRPEGHARKDVDRAAGGALGPHHSVQPDVALQEGR